MRSRFLWLSAAVTMAAVAPTAAWAQQVDAQKIANLKSQQTDIENRLAELQLQVDDAYAGKTYCSAEERQEDLRKLRALRREIAALRKEYADLKAGFIKLASTPTAGPQFDAAGIHPEDRQYWTKDDNDLAKLNDSSLAKADRVEQAPIRDCNEKKAAPTRPPAQFPPSTSPGGLTPSGKASVPPKGAAPLGGPVPGCTDKQRHDAILRLQEEILRIEEELIPIDGTTKEGRARQLQLTAELDRLKALMALACPPLLPPARNPPPAKPPQVPTFKVGNAVTPKQPKPQPSSEFGEFTVDPLTRLAWEAWFTYDDLDEAVYDCDWNDIEKLSGQLSDLAKRARELAKDAAAKGDRKRADDAETLARQLENAEFAGALIQMCREARLVVPHNEGAQPLGQKPTPPKHSIVEDLREPPTPIEVRAIEARIKELDELTRDYPNLLEGCQPGIWDKHIAHLEDLAKRARQIADDVKRGYTKGVSAADANRVADEAEKALEKARRGKAANVEQWKAPECPKYLPGPPSVPRPTLTIPLQLSPFAARILEIHNAERAAVGAQPLNWNPQLAQDATQWAQQLARTGQLTHAPREGRGIERENLGQGRIGWSPEQIVKSEWVSEKRDFVAGYFPNVARDGNWMNIAHYTQMIWPTTTDIGCGMAEGRGFVWLDCRYSPGGNKDGKPVGFQVNR